MKHIFRIILGLLTLSSIAIVFLSGYAIWGEWGVGYVALGIAIIGISWVIGDLLVDEPTSYRPKPPTRVPDVPPPTPPPG